jgi:hypothetical protein
MHQPPSSFLLLILVADIRRYCRFPACHSAAIAINMTEENKLRKAGLLTAVDSSEIGAQTKGVPPPPRIVDQAQPSRIRSLPGTLEG